jgi:2-polyprenyl-6-methoxyphenol hydroxylase-like FAD-dependent oxidoreductase
MLEKLTQTSDNSRLNLHFDRVCTAVDFAAKTITFHNTKLSTPTATELTVDYDLLIGADGARSIVRSYFLDSELFEFEQKYVPTDRWRRPPARASLFASGFPTDAHRSARFRSQKEPSIDGYM